MDCARPVSFVKIVPSALKPQFACIPPGTGRMKNARLRLLIDCIHGGLVNHPGDRCRIARSASP